MTKQLTALERDLLYALKIACNVIEAYDLDEMMAGEYEILTDAIEAAEQPLPLVREEAS